MECTKCGSIIEEGSYFCSKCGTRAEEPQAKPKQKRMNGLQHFISAIKKYAVFKGRARRAEFWWFNIFNMLILSAAIIFGEPTIFILACLCLFLPGLAVGIRRMHDVGKSGWYYFIPIYDIVLMATAGNTGPNKYGTDPKDA